MDPPASCLKLFYVTAGRGTECFAAEEIRNKLHAHIFSPSEETLEGKIFFGFEDDRFIHLKEVFRLKSVERIFVAICSYRNTEFLKGKRTFLDKLMAEVSCVQNYSFAQSVLEQLLSLAHDSSKETKSQEQFVTRTISRPKEKSGDGNCSSACKKVKLEEKDKPSLVCTVSQPDDHVCTDQDKTNLHRLENCPDISSSLNQEDDSGSDAVSFRLSIKCSGRTRKWLNIKKLSKDLSWRIARATNWIVDLRDPEHEISIHISDQYVTIGIPLTRIPLSRRVYLVDPGLRGPIAWIMKNLADIKAGDLVLDPMCGKGTLLLESCSELKEAIYLGVDNNTDQLNLAVKNAEQAGYGNRINFLKADALCLPLKANTVDAVLCDAPFNQKYFTSLEVDEFYSSFLVEMTRLLRTNKKFVLLTSHELSGLVINLLPKSGRQFETEMQSTTTNKHEEGSSSNKACGFASQSDVCEEGVTNESESSLTLSLELLSQHEVKLGETLATILVLKKLTHK